MGSLAVMAGWPLKRWLGLVLVVLHLVTLDCALPKEVKSKVGEKVGLPCCHEIPSSESLRNYRVYWQKNTKEVVLAYSKGEKISDHDQYKNRTELDSKNLTLWISPVEILDNGTYQCVVQHFRFSHDFSPRVLCDAPVSLSVTADFSEPNITSNVINTTCESTEMVVTCSSHGGFPKPKISGVFNNGSLVWNTTWVSESSLSPYNVTGKLHLNVTKDINLTCSVEYNGFVKSTSLLLTKTNDCIAPTMPPSYNVITATSIIFIIFLLAITLAARYFPRHACFHCSKNQDSMEEDEKESMKPPTISKMTSETSSL
ncbi:T-lymphocyte activation antigen CD80 isoform X1 [Oxyura jamaicensis]|uniref:T-lymphocyte activation antigen CD80 isoform X1 n=1 Tax=Oxyura jamaicensis TaxID=8884 RepID=UPI0015A6A55F|nr:T-lymphocyte activation antigen CD80 isoform X1 [Oxyura jamaicensis]